MFKVFLIPLLIIFNYSCSSSTSSLIGSGITLASGGSISKSTFAAGANLFIKETTGKNTFEHVADNTIYIEGRKCEVNHSAEINKIFFVTLDQIDCDREYINEMNLFYLR